jgi:aryl-alcohol dehydrogenase-like predicted oxidoreductase
LEDWHCKIGNETKDRLMMYRLLGNSGTAVTTFALGTMTFGAEADETASHRLLDRYVAEGGNFVDTADVYSRGASEEIVGRWLAAHPTDAEHVVIATKGRFAMGSGPNDVGTSRRHLTRALDASLRRLGVDQIDLYQLHAWDALTPLAETLRFLDDAVRSGKIAYYGFSNFLGWQLTKAVHVAQACGFTPPVTLQPQYSLLVREIEAEVVPAALDASVGLLPWSPLAGGWLSGKYRRDTNPTGATRLGEDPNRGMEAYGPRNAQDRTWRILDEVDNVARVHGVSQARVALAWLEGQPGVTSVILGARTIEQLADNLGATSLTLTLEQIDALTSVSTPTFSDYPYGLAGVEQRHRGINEGV